MKYIHSILNCIFVTTHFDLFPFFLKIYFFSKKIMEQKKRKRKKPDRLGENSKNMDYLFDNVDETALSKNEDVDFVDSAESDISIDSRSEKNPFKENGSENLLRNQMARLEAKLNQMFSILVQIQHACISNVVSTQMELENIQELPLIAIDSIG